MGEPMELWGGEVGLEKHTKKPKYANIFVLMNTFEYAFVCCQRIYKIRSYYLVKTFAIFFARFAHACFAQQIFS